MFRKSLCTFSLAATICLALAAQNPASGPAVSAPAQPHPYTITSAAGPWVIFLTSFSGSNAAALAEDMVSELRRDFKLPAYFFNRGAELQRAEEQRVSAMVKRQSDFLRSQGVEPGKVRVKKVNTVEEHYAVLIAGWKDMDSARKALDAIRKQKSPSEKFMETTFVIGPGANGGSEVKQAYLNPFQKAFVGRNPTVPREAAAPETGKPDRFLKDLNENVPNSLLKNPKRWTLVVKTYNAPVQITSKIDGSGNSSLMDKLGMGSRTPDALNAAAQQAHALAEALRHKSLNLEAYVFHTRTMSIVTVGGFDSPNDPQLLQMQKTLASLKLGTESLISPPAPVEVPRF
jgi:hypothetical protein